MPEEKDKEYWDGAHARYAEAEWIDKPTIFAQDVIRYFPPEGSILDLGGGQGQDARFFASQGYAVMLTDLSSEALAIARRKIGPDPERKIDIKQLDLSEPLPFKDGEFDVVYSHLALHYFRDAETRSIFAEIRRVLKPGGVLAVLLNSTRDPEYDPSRESEPGILTVDGIQKRFFSPDSLRQYIDGFEILLLDDEGETYKDRAKGVSNLVRFVGKRA